MNNPSAKQSANRISSRPRRFASTVSRRAKRRAYGQHYEVWPKLFSIIAIIGFAISVLAFFSVDEWAARSVKGLPEGLTTFFRQITDIGKADWMLIPSGILCLALVFYNWQSLPARRQVWLSSILFDAWFLFVAVAGSGILTNIIKFIVGRARPKYLEILGFGYFDPATFGSSFASFPSGHATTIAAFSTVFALRFPRLWPFFAALALLIGASRVFVSAHYPGDVIMGLTIGTLFALALARGFAVQKTGFRFVEKGGMVKVLPRRHLVRGAGRGKSSN